MTDLLAANQIGMFLYCAHCIKDKPNGISPRQWVSLEVGWTKQGLQIRCRRCDLNIIHIDFEGHKHPANTQGRDTTEVTPIHRS